MRSSILFSLQPYVTSDFGLHSLLTTIDIVASAMAAASYIPIAKLLDVWGRAEGYALMVGSATLGLILMACAETLQVFCAAQVRQQLRQSSHSKTDEHAGLLLHWLLRYNIHSRRPRCRRDIHQKSRSGLRFHILAVHDHRFCRTKSCRGVFGPCQLAMGFRCILHHCSCRLRASFLHPQDQPEEG